MYKHVWSFVRGLGPLRIMLTSAVLLMIVLRPVPGTEVAYEGWGMFPTLLFPTLAPILFMVLLLDAMMSRLLMTAKQGSERLRLRRAMLTDLAVAGLSLLVWYSYFSQLLSN